MTEKVLKSLERITNSLSRISMQMMVDYINVLVHQIPVHSLSMLTVSVSFESKEISPGYQANQGAKLRGK